MSESMENAILDFLRFRLIAKERKQTVDTRRDSYPLDLTLILGNNDSRPICVGFMPSVGVGQNYILKMVTRT